MSLFAVIAGRLKKVMVWVFGLVSLASTHAFALSLTATIPDSNGHFTLTWDGGPPSSHSYLKLRQMYPHPAKDLVTNIEKGDSHNITPPATGSYVYFLFKCHNSGSCEPATDQPTQVDVYPTGGIPDGGSSSGSSSGGSGSSSGSLPSAGHQFIDETLSQGGSIKISDLDLTQYDIYYRDLDNNGFVDFYFHSTSLTVLLHGDVVTPIVLPEQLSFAIYVTHCGSDECFYQIQVLEKTDAEVAAMPQAQQDYDYFLGDFNNDGLQDLLLRGANYNSPSLILQASLGNTYPMVSDDFVPGELASNLSNRSTRIRIANVSGDAGDDIIVEGDTLQGDKIYTSSNGRINAIYSEDLSPDSAAPSLVGASVGEFRVDESGASSYNVAMALPPGTAGVTPGVSLSYSSHSPNGIVGLGWSLAAGSSMARCRQTLATDSQVRPLSWSDEDRFCYNGQRLLKVSSENGETIYRTEIDSFNRITAFGNLANPSHFTVEAKDGSVTTYGGTAVSRVSADANKTMTWSISRFEDNMGNPIVYNYAGGLNDHRLSSIDYAFGKGTTAGARVVFEYESRDASDTLRVYAGGYEFKTTQRLKRIISYNGNSEFRRLNMGYNRSSANDVVKKTRLGLIQECVGSECLPALTFDWSIAGLGFGPASSQSISRDPDRILANFTPADINGDGIADLVWVDQRKSLHYMISDGEKLVKAKFYNAVSSSLFLGSTDPNRADQMPKLSSLDYNADGRDDIAFTRDNRWHVLLSAPFENGEWLLKTTSIDTGLSGNDTKFVDFNSDGLVDAVNNSSYRLLEKKPGESESSSTYYHFGNAQSLTVPIFSSLRPPQSQCPGESAATYLESPADYNADGQIDFVVREVYTTFDCSNMRTTSSQTTRRALVRSDEGLVSYATISSGGAGTVNPVDINGDSLIDVFYKTGTDRYAYRLNTGSGFGSETSFGALGNNDYSPQFVDYDRDGDTDVVYHHVASKVIRVRPWTGTSFGSVRTVLNTDGSDTPQFFMDTNGDGFADFVHLKDEDYIIKLANGLPVGEADNIIHAFDNGLGNRTDVYYEPLNKTDHYKRIDVNPVIHTQEIEHDLPCAQLQNAPGCHSYTVTQTVTTADSSEFYSKLNGDWDVLPGSVTLGKDQPVLEVNGPMYVVTRVESSSPSASETQPQAIDPNTTAAVEYFYSEAKLQAAGRGHLGFRTLKTVDQQSGVATKTTYRQDFPFQGMPELTESFSDDTSSAKILSTSANLYAYDSVSHTNGTTSYRPYLKTSIESTFDPDAQSTTTLTSVTTVTNQDGYGNVTDVTVTTEGGDLKQTTVTTNTYYEESEWEKRMGRLKNTQVTTSIEGGASRTRNTEFSYYAQNSNYPGLLKQSILKPGNSQLNITSIYTYDDFGNQVQTETRDADNNSRLSNLTVYDASGRYIDKTYDDLGEVNGVLLSEVPEGGRDALGRELTIRSLGGIEISKTYDVLGAELSTSTNVTGSGPSASASAQSWSEYDLCGGSVDCPAGAKTRTEKSDSAGGRTQTFTDALGRIVRESAIDFTGQNWIHVDTEYDLAGRVKRISQPYSGVTPKGWDTNYYDTYGRIEKIISADNTETTFGFNGFESSVTNHKLQTKVEVKNALGQLVKAIDANQGFIEYEYDIDGNLHKLYEKGTGDRNNVTEINHDILGRKTRMSDPDKGIWHYEYNGFGELIKQTDAKGQVSEMGYDRYGRMTWRTDYQAFTNTIETDTRWLYGTVSFTDRANVVHQVGDDKKPAAVIMHHGALSGVPAKAAMPVSSLSAVCQTQSNLCEFTQYDNFGRPVASLISLPEIDSLYRSVTEFDDYGRVSRSYDVLDKRVTGASGVNMPLDGQGQYRSGTENHYNSAGYLYRVTDIASGDTLQYITSQNDAGQVTGGSLFGDLLMINTYEPNTNLLASTQVSSKGTALQSNTYVWDELGNLKQRSRKHLLSTGTVSTEQESFCYDSLNRLKAANLDQSCGAQNYFYDALGNITKKPGISTYRYPTSANTPVSLLSDRATSLHIADVDGNGSSEIVLPAGSDIADSLTRLSAKGVATDLQFTEGGHVAFYGDLNSDGISDIFLQGQEQFILLHGDIATPIVFTLPSIAVYGTSSGGYSAPVAHQRASVAGLTPAAQGDLVVANFNGLGTNELLVRGAGSTDTAVVIGLEGTPTLNDVVFVNTVQFDNGGPHAVGSVTYTGGGTQYFHYDANGNVSRDTQAQTQDGVVGGRVIDYTTFDKPSRIVKGSGADQHITEFKYGPSRGRYQRVDIGSEGRITTTYLGNIERRETDKTIEWKRALPGGSLWTYRIDKSAGSETRVSALQQHVLLKDHLGSTDMIVEIRDNLLGISQATVVQNFSYDAFGLRRNAIDWTQISLEALLKANPLSLTGLEINAITTRGYTGHEMLDEVGLIHMNGRIYDARLGRFMQADPHIQAPTHTQSLNRYAYVLNNPLNATDPTGFFFKKIVKQWKRSWRQLEKQFKRSYLDLAKISGKEAIHRWLADRPGLSMAIQTALNYIPVFGQLASAHFAMDRSLYATGSFTQGVKTGVISYAGSQIGGLGQAAGGGLGGLVAQGIAGGVLAEVQGGKFAHGFVSAGLGSAIGSVVGGVTGAGLNTVGITGFAQRLIVRAVVGGTMSEITGGKFSNGARSAAFQVMGEVIGQTVAAGIGNIARSIAKANSSGGSGCSVSSNPINIATGEKYLTMTDYQAVGASKLKFERYYSSYAQSETTLGMGWRSNFDRQLRFNVVGNTQSDDGAHAFTVQVLREQGDAINFVEHLDEQGQSVWRNTAEHSGSARGQAVLERDGEHWLLTLADNSTERYDNLGRLLSIEELGGYRQSLSYIDSGRHQGLLARVEDSAAQHLSFSYDALARLSRVTATDGSQTHYRYDAQQRLAQVFETDDTPSNLADTPYKRYTYAEGGSGFAITGIFDHTGTRLHTMAYDQQGRAVLSALADDAERVDMVFMANRTTQVTNSLGRTTVYQFNEHNRPLTVEGQATASCIGANQGYDYDSRGNLLSKTDWNGSQTQYQYNDRNLETLRIEAAGTDAERRIATRWHSDWRLPIERIEPTRTTQWRYDERGLVIEKIVRDTTQADGLSSSESWFDSLLSSQSNDSERRWRYDYNDQGLLIAQNGPRDDVQDITRFSYDAAGNRVASTNALGHTSEVLEFNERGLPLRQRDANGIETQLSYNARGWLSETRVQLPEGERRTVYHYSDRANYQGQGQVSRIELADGSWLAYAYDGAGRMIRETNSLGERVDYRLDLEGNRVREQRYALDAQGGAQLVQQQQRVFDELSQLLESIGADGSRQQFGYDAAGNQIAQIDANGNTTDNAFDALNRLISVTDAQGGVVNQRYTWDNQLASVTDQRGLVTEYRYNGFGERIAQISPDTGTTVYQYDAAGNVIAQIDARGAQRISTYDALNRVTSEHFSFINNEVGETAETDAEQTRHYQYDQAEHGYYNIGRLTQVSDSSGEHRYHYAADGQLAEQTSRLWVNDVLAAPATQRYQYNAAGQLMVHTYPSGRSQRFDHNDLGQLVGLYSADRINDDSTLVTDNLVATVSRTAFGREQSWQLGELRLSHSRDHSLRLSGIDLVNAANDSLYQQSYDFDAAGNIVAITDGLNAQRNKVYGYDSLNRLTQAELYQQGQRVLSTYGYDAVGNRTARRQSVASATQLNEVYTYSDTSNRLLSVSAGAAQSRVIHYDAAGNTVLDTQSGNKGTRTLGYSADNRPEWIERGDRLIRYTHNHWGQRVSKQVFGQEQASNDRLYHFDAAKQLIAETDLSGQPVLEYLYVNGLRIAQIDYRHNKAGELQYLINDHLATPQLMLANNDIIWRSEALAFGEDPTVAEQALSFPGQLADLDSGYTYNYFRDYDPSLGRYIQSDPIGLLGGVNTFGYVLGNPVGLVDPFGLDSGPYGNLSTATDYASNAVFKEMLDNKAYGEGITGVSVAIYAKDNSSMFSLLGGKYGQTEYWFTEVAANINAGTYIPGVTASNNIVNLNSSNLIADNTTLVGYIFGSMERGIESKMIKHALSIKDEYGIDVGYINPEGSIYICP